jgi:uncharacterized membrane protein YphA (DoxX/SURF4 family)
MLKLIVVINSVTAGKFVQDFSSSLVAGGILLCLGLFTRIAASLVAFVMLIATLVANINYTGSGQLIRQDGVVTIAGFLFACIFIFWGGGKFSADNFIFKKTTAV